MSNLPLSAVVNIAAFGQMQSFGTLLRDYFHDINGDFEVGAGERGCTASYQDLVFQGCDERLVCRRAPRLAAAVLSRGAVAISLHELAKRRPAAPIARARPSPPHRQPVPRVHASCADCRASAHSMALRGGVFLSLRAG